MKIHAIVNFEALEAKDTIVKAYLNEEQADKALEAMQSGEDDNEPYIYAGEVISFDVEPAPEQQEGETARDFALTYLRNNNCREKEEVSDAIHAAINWQSQHTATALAESQQVIQHLEDKIIVGIAERNEKDKRIQDLEAKILELKSFLQAARSAIVELDGEDRQFAVQLCNDIDGVL